MGNSAGDRMAQPLTAEIVDFADVLSFSDIPAAVIDRGKAHILDSLGLALTGAGSDVVRILLEDLRELGSAGRASVLGHDGRLAARHAALVNATAMHADNFDDTNPQESSDRNGGIHATVPVLAATLAVGEDRGAGGADMLTALHAGVEIACRLNHAIGARHYEDGFHSTATLSAFGAAIAAAKLAKLDAERMTQAIAGVASRAAGVRRNFGAMVEQMHPGQAAEAGIAAAELSERGLTGAPDALDGPFGYLQAAGGGADLDAISGRLGTPWAFVDPGTWIKPFPNGALTHPAMTLTARLIEQNDIAAERVSRIEVRTNRRMLNTLIHHRPQTGAQAKFSMEFALSALVLYRKAGLAEFVDRVAAHPEIRAMMERIDYDAFDSPEPDFTNVTTFVAIETTNGVRFEGRADFAKGSTQDPMSFGEVAEKFRQCADYAGWTSQASGEIVGIVSDLEHISGLSALTALLRR